MEQLAWGRRCLAMRRLQISSSEARKAPLARVGRKLPKGNGATIRNKYSVTYVHELRARERRANAKRGAGTLRWQRRSKASGEEDDTSTEDMKGIAA
jgi:hypothetical protein